MNEKCFSDNEIQVLLGDAKLGEDEPFYRWNRAGEQPGIYWEPIGLEHALPSEISAITGGLVSTHAAKPFPLLALPCTLQEFLHFENCTGIFRGRLHAGDETDDLLKDISAINKDAGTLAKALVYGIDPEHHADNATSQTGVIPAKTTINTPKKARRTLLTPLIETAQKEVDNKDKYNAPAIWNVLLRMAGDGVKPLVGVCQEGIQWMNANDEPRYLSLKNLRDVLHRQLKKLPKTRQSAPKLASLEDSST